MLIKEISKSEIVEEYYGNKYYLYEVNYTISFSIEHEKATIYILDYSKESDLPIIHIKSKILHHILSKPYKKYALVKMNWISTLLSKYFIF